MMITDGIASLTMLLAGNISNENLTTILVIGITLTALVLIIQLVIISKLSKNKESSGSSGRNNANNYVDNVIARINEQEQAEQAENGEIAAVIAAAIHAYIQDQAAEVPADGFFVRSIKRMEARRR